jgi:hypothetical protein
VNILCFDYRLMAFSDILKRPLPIHIKYDLCILCQKTFKSDDHDVSSTSKGKESLINAVNIRKKHKESDFVDVIERCEAAFVQTVNSIVWHRKCHQQFKNKTMLDRLSKKHVPKVPVNFDVASVQSTSNQMTTRASSVGSFNQKMHVLPALQYCLPGNKCEYPEGCSLPLPYEGPSRKYHRSCCRRRQIPFKMSSVV